MVLERLKEYIDLKGVTVAAFERSIGMSNASFGKSLKQGKGIGSDKLEKILSVYPDINPSWLLTGAGEILLSKTPKNVTLSKGDILGDGKGDKPKLQKTSPFTEYPTGEESFEKNVADVAVDKVFKLRTDRLIDRQQIPNGISEENLLRFLSYYNDVNPIWLLTGEGEILLTKTPKIPVKSRIPER